MFSSSQFFSMMHFSISMHYGSSCTPCSVGTFSFHIKSLCFCTGIKQRKNKKNVKRSIIVYEGRKIFKLLFFKHIPPLSYCAFCAWRTYKCMYVGLKINTSTQFRSHVGAAFGLENGLWLFLSAPLVGMVACQPHN